MRGVVELGRVVGLIRKSLSRGWRTPYKPPVLSIFWKKNSFQSSHVCKHDLVHLKMKTMKAVQLIVRLLLAITGAPALRVRKLHARNLERVHVVRKITQEVFVPILIGCMCGRVHKFCGVGSMSTGTQKRARTHTAKGFTGVIRRVDPLGACACRRYESSQLVRLDIG